ncbi:hypothetical protein B296_00056530, partial [Ensete ventricosum]
FLRELPAGADLREGGRGRKGPVGREVNGPEVLGMPGRCSHEKGTAEEGRNGDAPSSMRMGLLRRGGGRPYREDPAERVPAEEKGRDFIATRARGEEGKLLRCSSNCFELIVVRAWRPSDFTNPARIMKRPLPIRTMWRT